MKLRHTRIKLSEANAFVEAHHRHHKRVIGHLFSFGAVLGDQLVGVAIVGRPVSLVRDDTKTAEVTRLCTDGTRNACSFLYGASAKAAFALGFERIGTYILASEGGASVMAAGWRLIGQTKGGSWSRARAPTRRRPSRNLFLKPLRKGARYVSDLQNVVAATSEGMAQRWRESTARISDAS